ncbi:Alkaline phosphatase synthesis sensor protein PhoR [compost metagenome]
MEENPNLPQEQQKQAAIIRQQGVKLRELVKDLNLVSMLEYEMQPLVNKPMRLAPIARQVASDFLNNGLDEKYNIQLDIEDETVTVNGDEKLLTRALTNLVQNSITHNPQGCEIRIQIPQSNIAQQLCSIIVFDNGQGISQDQLSDLMELPYSDKRKHRRSNGHGLGLPIVTRITKAHGGQLELFSDIQEGLTAIIYLPKNIESQVCSHK